jgi:molybdate transport system ATP-binding protein
VGLADRAHARPEELSGGQAQRVALARALAIEPAVLLLDEPLAALDATTRNEVRRDLLAYLKEFGGFRIVVTHDPVDAAALADRVVVIEDGAVTQEGPPIEIISRPRTAWVADLAGTNLLRGRADGADVAITGGGALVTADPHDGDVLVAVHPHGVAIHVERPHGSPRNVWLAAVVEVEPLGERVRVRLDGPPPIVAELTAAAASELALRPGSSVWASVKATELAVYPAI